MLLSAAGTGEGDQATFQTCHSRKSSTTTDSDAERAAADQSPVRIRPMIPSN
jgi:hypothetical protein